MIVSLRVSGCFLMVRINLLWNRRTITLKTSRFIHQITSISPKMCFPAHRPVSWDFPTPQGADIPATSTCRARSWQWRYRIEYHWCIYVHNMFFCISEFQWMDILVVFCLRIHLPIADNKNGLWWYSKWGVSTAGISMLSYEQKPNHTSTSWGSFRAFRVYSLFDIFPSQN